MSGSGYGATPNGVPDVGAHSISTSLAPVPIRPRGRPPRYLRRLRNKKETGGLGGPSAAAAAGAGSARRPGGKKVKKLGISAPSSFSSRATQLRLPLVRELLMPESVAAHKAGVGAAGAEGVVPSPRGDGVDFGMGLDGAGGDGSSSVAAANGDFVPGAGSIRLVTDEDAIKFFARHGTNTPVKFVYCNRWDEEASQAPGAPESRKDITSDDYRPYDLVVVPRKRVKPEYFTIGASGVVHVQPGSPSEFISLSDWMHQRTMFNVLRSIRFFKTYLITKMFRLWRNNVRHRVYCKQRKLLARSLFVARPSFCQPLLEVRRTLQDISSVRLMDLSASEPQLAADFENAQGSTRTTAARAFERTVARLEEIVEQVCDSVKERARIDEFGIASDDLSRSRFAQHLIGENGRVQSMVSVKKERAQRLRRLKHAALEAEMLGDFVRLVDYMQVEQLAGLTTKHASRFLRELCLPNRKPMFITRVSFGDSPGRIDFSPTVGEFEQLSARQMSAMVSTVDTVERIYDLSRFRPFVAQLQAERPHLAQIILNDAQFQSDNDNILTKIRQDFVLARERVSTLESHRDCHNHGINWNVEEYKAKTHTLATIQADMAQQVQWKESIELELRSSYDAGMFLAETKGLKNDLIPATVHTLSDMKDLLLQMFHDQCAALQTQYKDMIAELDKDPQGLQLYAAHVENFAAIKDSGADLQQQTQTIESMHDLLIRHEMKIPPADAVAFTDLQATAQDFEQQLRVSEQRIDDKMGDMRVMVYKYIDRLKKELAQKKHELAEGIFVQPTALPSAVLEQLEKIRTDLDDIKAQTQTLQEYQVLFKMEPYSFPSMPDTVKAFEKTHLFWQTYDNWKKATHEWRTASFLSLDVEKMNEEVREFYMTVHKLNKEANDLPVTLQLKNTIAEWRAVMPMVVELGNPALKRRHWDQLFMEIGVAYTMSQDDQLTLQKLKEMRVFNRKKAIDDICEQAVKEHQLRQGLEKIKHNWNQQMFLLAPYQQTKDVFILGDVEELTALLEDNQVTLQTMLNAQHIAAIQADVETWDQRLSTLSDILDAWLVCQRNWMYLEPIFGAPDIQRQLPMEAKMFADVDRFWKDIMRKVHSNPLVMATVTPSAAERVLAQFMRANKELETVQKHLEEYLETKRSAFPRFYFLSNDELLQILSQSREPQAVQPHLRKCFDNVDRLIFTDVEDSIEVIGMISGEGERVDFTRPIFTQGATESWLSEVETVMRKTVKTRVQEALLAYPPDGLHRNEWLVSHPAQAVSTVDQIMWTQGASRALTAIASGEDPDAMVKFLAFSKQQIASMVELVRGDLQKLERKMFATLIILDVHARDVVQRMVDAKCRSLNDFEWSKQLRYYWEGEEPAVELSAAQKAEQERRAQNAELGLASAAAAADSNADDLMDAYEEAPEWQDCIVRQTSAEFVYRYEYLGNSSRLVITPLTDKAYLTLTGALHLHYGGAPAGPAGTGKTETVKDLAKSLAVQIVVFNCSDGLTAKMMSRFFSGLAQAGAWACFDEFNRIDIEVLSVIAQQILTIQQAIAMKSNPFDFEGRLIPLDSSFGVFITMNPGYAGRTELPDNLKALFRPVAMMVPDYALIAEIILFSEGFQTAASLSKKMVQLYKLSSEQLSKQDHYDFGMRAVKSVLVMAGSLKRQDDTVAEDVVLIRAMRDSNVPKFLSQDLPLFRGIISDLFPGVDVPFVDYGELQSEIESQLSAQRLQCVPDFITKVIQLHETMIVRHGVMLVGTTGTGKTTCSDTLARALTGLHAKGIQGSNFAPVEQFRLNPKAVTMGELYGEVNPITYDWTDGLVANVVRQAASDKTEIRKWVVFDGPVDALWIENMNTVLDDNKVLCLANSERIKLSSTMTMLFEVQDLAVASPATVSRCGMVYLEPVHLGWKPLVDTWLQLNSGRYQGQATHVSHILKDHVGDTLSFIRSSCKEMIASVDSNLVQSCLNLLDALMAPFLGAPRRENHAIEAQREEMKQNAVQRRRRSSAAAITSTAAAEIALGLARKARDEADAAAADAQNAVAAAEDDPEGSPAAIRAAELQQTAAELEEAAQQAELSAENAKIAAAAQAASAEAAETPQISDDALIPASAEPEVEVEDFELEQLVRMNLFLAMVWSFGGNLHESSRPLFSEFLRSEVGSDLVPNLPASGSCFDYCIDMETHEFVTWTTKVPDFHYNPKTPYFNILVPTEGTTKYSLLLEALVSSNMNVLMMGSTGVGKTVVVQQFLQLMAADEEIDLNADDEQNSSNDNGDGIEGDDDALADDFDEKEADVGAAAAGAADAAAFGSGGLIAVSVVFSAQTSSRNLQDFIETKFEKKRKNLLGAPIGKKMVLFVDDLNMPQREEYGAQPAVELLRQAIDQGGLYDREKFFFKTVADTVYIAAMAPPGGGRNPITPRLLRHFHMLWQPDLPEHSLKKIFNCILGGFLSVTAEHFQTDLAKVTSSLVDASVDIYQSIRTEMLPTPAKSHYTFNLRDLSKVVQGVCQISNTHLPSLSSLLRLWLHECARVFRDRLVDENDREWFDTLCASKLKNTFALDWQPNEFRDLLFGDYLTQEDRAYQEVKSMDTLVATLQDYLVEYNLVFSNQMNLVFFQDAIAHVSRISRILRQPRGNALLVGVGGSGRQSLTRLAAFMSNYKCKSIEITRNYTVEDWHESLKELLETAGAENQPVVFLLTDSQVVHESFLEDVNNLLNCGEVPNLFEHDEIEQIIIKCRPLAKAAGKRESRDAVLAHFVQTVRENLHIVLAFSPIGDAFRDRCRRYPSMVNCCTIDWYNPWPKDALLSVSERFLSQAKNLGLESWKDQLGKVCVRMHMSVTEISKRFLAEQRRNVYVTPTSFLELINMYTSMLSEQKELVTNRILRYRNGLTRLQDTNMMVEQLKNDLVQLQPVLEQSAQETAQLLVELEKDQAEANQTKAICAEEAAKTEQTTREVQAIKDECKRNLEEAMPAYESAIAALSVLRKEHVTVIKSFQHPPQGVKTVMEAVCVMFGVTPSWDEAKRLLSKLKFLEMCMNFDKDNIPQRTIRKLKVYINDPDFLPEKLESVSQAAVSLCMWVRAMHKYAGVAKAIEPKRKALAAAEKSLEAAEAQLAAKQMNLRVVEARVEQLQLRFEAKQAEKQQLIDRMEKTQLQLQRAEKLVAGLSSEEARWQEAAERLNDDLTNLVGNMILSAGCISYLGPFTAPYRAELLQNWNQFCLQQGVPVDENMDLVRVLADPIVLRQWSLMGLPKDSYSVQNGIFVTRGRRWPLMIDPQGQANRWIKSLTKKDNLQIIKLNEPNFLRVLENAIRYGQPVLLENVGEHLDAALEPVLTKQIFKKGGQWLLRLGDQDVPYSHDFRFFITTKLPNPHYLPEVFVKVTVINFTVTPKGLEDQLLVAVCSMERPDLEQKNDQLIVSIADDKQELADIEATILRMLSEVQGNILDDESLIETLAASKKTSADIKTRMAEAETTVAQIEKVREEYRVVATRGSILFFVIADLALIDPMYQYSLQYFAKLYRQRISETEKSEDLQTRLDIVLKDLNESIFRNICQGLFEKHKLLFSFLIACQIARQAGEVSPIEWSVFLRGNAGADDERKSEANPASEWLPEGVWTALHNLPAPLDQVAGDVASSPSDWKDFYEGFSNDFPAGGALPNGLDAKLTAFQRLLTVKTFRPERVVDAVKAFVSAKLGASFIKPPPFDLASVFQASSPTTPVIFVLSPGANPMQYLLKLASDQGLDSSRFKYISLGQGQGPIAEELMEQGRSDGSWVCLQNCHLATSWMPELERILEAAASDDVHPDFRLWLTSMPTPKFSVPVLQNSVKVTNEPPKGLANNVMRTFLDITEEEYEGCSRPREFKKLLFGLAFFHAVCQERRKFGAIGWNIPYDWMNSDLQVSKKQLKLYLESQDTVPWETLQQIIGEVNYAGRVTDDKDQRCVRSVLSRYLCEDMLDDNYQFADSAAYKAPPQGSLADVRRYISELPDDTPDVFGLHDNASITLQLKESNELLSTVVAIQPRVSSDEAGQSPDELVASLAHDIEGRLPAPLKLENAHESTFAGVESGINTLGVFLSQEVIRFNKLLDVLSSTLRDLQLSIKGLVVMSNELDVMFKCLMYNLVPPAWAEAAYPSCKPLGAWVDDLIARVEFMRKWLTEGPPPAFWLSGFFFPQGFMTAVLQKYARKTRIPIDTLRFSTVAMKQQVEEIKEPPQKGVYIFGCHLQGASWDITKGHLVDPLPGALFAQMPVILLEPSLVSDPRPENVYECPVYKTSRRAGTLSTTGHSTNFVLYLELPTGGRSSNHWIQRGAAVLLALDEK